MPVLRREPIGDADSDKAAVQIDGAPPQRGQFAQAQVKGRREALSPALREAIRAHWAVLLPILRTWRPVTAVHVLYLLYEAVPSEPFQLDQARFVSDPVSCRVRLYRDVQAGPQGPRARTGALQEDLRLLYTLDIR